MMSSDQQFFLKWNDFQTNMVTSFRHLRDEKSFTDVSNQIKLSRSGDGKTIAVELLVKMMILDVNIFWSYL